jgi:hypothetical protein
MVDHITPYVVLAINPTEEKVTIKKRTRLTTIYKYEPDTTYFITTAKNTFKALTIATTLGISYTPNTTDQRQVPSSNISRITPLTTRQFGINSPVPSIPGEFDLTNQTRAVCRGQLDNTNPGDDTVYQITESIGVNDNTPVPNNNNMAKPRIAKISGSLNIKTPDNTPFQLTKHGVHVYTANREQAAQFRRLYKHFNKV